MRRESRRKPILATIALAFLTTVSAGAWGAGAWAESASEEVRVREVRYCMGTRLDLTIYARSKEEGRSLLNESFHLADALEASLSNYRSESAVEQFNRQSLELLGEKPGSGRSSFLAHPIKIHPDLYLLLSEGERLSRQTEGIFDVTVRTAVNAWKSAAERGAVPTAAELQRVRALTGQHLLELRPPDAVLRRAPVQIEAGGIGKGMAVDRIARFLRSAGIKRGFLNFGTSSITALGAPPGQTSWEAELRFTDTLSLGVVPLNNATLSLSHSFGQGAVIQGVRYGHVIDPRTAMPLTEGRGAAVITESATEGEALSKYLVIRGSLPEGRPLTALIVFENGTRSASSSFARLMK